MQQMTYMPPQVACAVLQLKCGSDSVGLVLPLPVWTIEPLPSTLYANARGPWAMDRGP